jgi:hypothetical protein
MSLYKEMGIDSQVNIANAELKHLRQQTMGYTHVDGSGTVTVDTGNPEYIALQSKIAVLEGKLVTVDALKTQVSALIGGHSVPSLRALRELAAHHQNTIDSAPVRAFDMFKMKHELAIEQGNAAVRLAMPSEVAALLDGYQAEEDALKAAQTASQAAIVAISADLLTIDGMAMEARAALRD